MKNIYHVIFYLLTKFKLATNIADVVNQFFKAFKELHSHNTRRSQQYLLNISKANTQTLGSNSVKTKSIND